MNSAFLYPKIAPAHRADVPTTQCRTIEMAKNTDQGYRIGSVLNRSQTFNPKTDQYVKRDDTSGRFMAAKLGPYKGVAHEPDGRK